MEAGPPSLHTASVALARRRALTDWCRSFATERNVFFFVVLAGTGIPTGTHSNVLTNFHMKTLKHMCAIL